MEIEDYQVVSWQALAIFSFVVSVVIVSIVIVAKSANRRQATGTCGLCKSAQTATNPLIEGMSGLLVYEACLNKLATLAHANSEPDDDQLAMSLPKSDTNPYKPPAQSPALTCELCGDYAKPTVSVDRNSTRAICTNCISVSLELIRAHRSAQGDE